MSYAQEATSEKQTLNSSIQSFQSIIGRLTQLSDFTSGLANRVAGSVPTPSNSIVKEPERIHQSMIELAQDKYRLMSNVLDQVEENLRRLDNNL